MNSEALSRSIPRPYFALGAAGLIPFVAGALGAWLLPLEHRALAVQSLVFYGAVILSFVGALHWGVAMQSRGVSRADAALAAAWSVVPALVAWGALHLPARAALGVLALTLVIHLAMDRWLAERFPVPGWYFRLRAALTAVGATCLALAAFA